MLVPVMLALLALLAILGFCYRARYVKVGRDEVLVVSGRRRRLMDPAGQVKEVDYRIVRSGGTFVWPFLEKTETLSTELMTAVVGCASERTLDGVAVQVKGVAQFKVDGKEPAVHKAVDQLRSKTPLQVMQIGEQILEGHVRENIRRMTADLLHANLAGFEEAVQLDATADFAQLGLQFLHVTFTGVSDDHRSTKR